MNPLGKGKHISGHHAKRYYEGICAFCGEMFISGNKMAIYCPEPKTCGNKAYQERRRRKEGRPKRKRYNVEKWDFKTVYPINKKG